MIAMIKNVEYQLNESAFITLEEASIERNPIYREGEGTVYASINHVSIDKEPKHPGYNWYLAFFTEHGGVFKTAPMVTATLAEVEMILKVTEL